MAAVSRNCFVWDFSALAIAIHNFPEGLATFIAAIQDPALGISIAIAVAIHNIPEGVAVSVPVYFPPAAEKGLQAVLSFRSCRTSWSHIGVFPVYAVLQ